MERLNGPGTFFINTIIKGNCQPGNPAWNAGTALWIGTIGNNVVNNNIVQ